MDNSTSIEKLKNFKKNLQDWSISYGDPYKHTKLRSIINHDLKSVRDIVKSHNCLHTLTIAPPPAVGGMIMQNVDPFSLIFSPPYGIDISQHVIDMLDQTIGELANTDIASSSQHLEQNKHPNRNSAFIVMAIDSNIPELEDILDTIKAASLASGIIARRVDDNKTNNRITDTIIESISTSEYVIVDLSYPRPNVYYEAGYAHGIGKLPIYLAKEGTKLEFDLKDYPVIFFKNMKQLKEGLTTRLKHLTQ